MKCPACSNEMVKAQATDYGQPYDYCKSCKKELVEITRDLSKPIQFAADERIVGYDKGYSSGKAGFDGTAFLCLGGCGMPVDPAKKYCKPTCGMGQKPSCKACNVPAWDFAKDECGHCGTTGATIALRRQTKGRWYGSSTNPQTLPKPTHCAKIIKGCDCHDCMHWKTISHTYAYADIYNNGVTREAVYSYPIGPQLPCRTETLYNTSKPSGVEHVPRHYKLKGTDRCHCGSFSAPVQNSAAKSYSLCASSGCNHQRDGHSSFCPAHRGTPPPDTY